MREQATGFLKAFRDFALKGNVVDLAIAVIVGGAFGKIVSSLVADIIMPLVNPLIPGGDWRQAVVGPGVKLGAFLGTVVDFIIVALVLFLVIRGFERFRKKEEVVATVAPDPKTLAEERFVAAVERLALLLEKEKR